MLISTLLGAWMSMKAAKDEAFMAAITQHQKGVQEARGKVNKHFQITRRIIALTTVFFVIAFPKIVAVWYPEIAVTTGYYELQQGFLFFSDDTEIVKWREAKGLVISPLDSNLCAAIAGLYYGGKAGR